jgi:hypothetical protein
VTLTWRWAQESEGGREESVARRPAPFEAEAGDTGEGWVRYEQGRAAGRE